MNIIIKRWTLCTIRFTQGKQGTSAFEYSLLLALIAGAIIVAMYGFGAFTSDTIAKVNGGISENKIEASSIIAKKTAETTIPLKAKETSDVAKWSFITVCFVILMIASACYVLSLKNMKKQKKLRPRIVEVEPSEPPSKRLFSKRHQILNALNGDIDSKFNEHYIMRHLMSDEITSIPPNFPVKDIKKIMEKKALRHLMVCDEGKQLLGIISDRDLVKSWRKTAADIMTRDPIVVSSDTLVSPAITMMINEGISCLPVIDGGKLCGIFTTTDVMLTLQCTLQIIQKAAVQFGNDFTNKVSQPLDEEPLTSSM